MPSSARIPSRDHAVPRDLLGLTLRHVESMSRGELIDHLSRFAGCFPLPLGRDRIESRTDEELRQLVNRARRKIQGMGY